MNKVQRAGLDSSSGFLSQWVALPSCESRRSTGRIDHCRPDAILRGARPIRAAAALLILLCFAVPAHAHAEPGERMRRSLHVSIGCSMIATGIDYGVTMFALGGGKLREANSLLAPFSDNPAAFGAIKMGTAVGVNYLLLRMHESKPKTSLAIGLGSCVTYSLVSVINTRRLDRVHGGR